MSCCLSVYFLYCITFAFCSIFSFSRGGNIYSLIGLFVDLVLPLFFWVSIFIFQKNKFSSELYLQFFILIGILNSIGAIVQYHVSPDLFGLIHNDIYSSENHSITQRAISFYIFPSNIVIIFGFFTQLDD